jgi:hypothetical protein
MGKGSWAREPFPLAAPSLASGDTACLVSPFSLQQDADRRPISVGLVLAGRTFPFLTTTSLCSRGYIAEDKSARKWTVMCGLQQ